MMQDLIGKRDQTVHLISFIYGIVVNMISMWLIWTIGIPSSAFLVCMKFTFVATVKGEDSLG